MAGVMPGESPRPGHRTRRCRPRRRAPRATDQGPDSPRCRPDVVVVRLLLIQGQQPYDHDVELALAPGAAGLQGLEGLSGACQARAELAGTGDREPGVHAPGASSARWLSADGPHPVGSSPGGTNA